MITPQDTEALVRQMMEALESRCGTNAEERGPEGAITAAREWLEAQAAEAPVRPQWRPATELPPRWKHSPESVVVLAIAETDDGGLQMTPARVAAMSKSEWREVRFDHNGVGRKLVVRCWTEMPKWPNPVPAASPQPDILPKEKT